MMQRKNCRSHNRVSRGVTPPFVDAAAHAVEMQRNAVKDTAAKAVKNAARTIVKKAAAKAAKAVEDAAQKTAKDAAAKIISILDCLISYSV